MYLPTIKKHKNYNAHVFTMNHYKGCQVQYDETYMKAIRYP